MLRGEGLEAEFRRFFFGCAAGSVASRLGDVALRIGGGERVEDARRR